MPKKRRPPSYVRPGPSEPITWREQDALDIEDYIRANYDIWRPPTIACRVMAIVLELWRHKKPWPQRAHIAEALGCSIFGLDDAIATAQSRGLIMLRVDTLAGAHLEQRRKVLQVKYYLPTDLLLGTVRQRRRVA